MALSCIERQAGTTVLDLITVVDTNLPNALMSLPFIILPLGLVIKYKKREPNMRMSGSLRLRVIRLERKVIIKRGFIEDFRKLFFCGRRFFN
tara:strand:+ start:707 stop:982 length:276 start_codon:yes stop_codon:yes gene_type:complete